MPNLSRRARWIAALAGIVVYFTLAAYLKFSYVDLTPPGRTVIALRSPFERYGNANIAHSEELNSFGDDENDEDGHSPIVIYEERRPLGPGHSTFADISALGAGRFAHWQHQGIVFSSSDNSDPNTNRRHYWAVLP